ncbi:retrovirus-related pol polyprotein from transposon TNT 1-94 [Tanacetum coccineum]
MAGLWFKSFRGDRTGFKETILGILLRQEIGELSTELPKRPQNSDYFKEKMLLMQAQENGVDLDEEKLLFLAGGQPNTFDDEVDEGPVQDMAQKKDNIFQADQCDTFNSDVDEALTTQTMFMANLSSADPVYDEAGLSYDSDTLSEVQDHDNCLDNMNESHEEHEIHNDDNEDQVVHSDVSSVPNDAVMIITNDIYEQDAQCVTSNKPNNTVNASLTAKLARYKELAEVYEKRAQFELTERELMIDTQMRMIIKDRNVKEESLQKELHSVKMQLNSTLNHNKLIREEVSTLKQDFKQKENKLLEEFLDMKHLKEKVEDKLYKQDQSLQTVHMLCKPKSFYDEVNRVAIGYKNPFYLSKAKQVQPALYNGHEIVKTNHARTLVHHSEDTLEIAQNSQNKDLTIKVNALQDLNERFRAEKEKVKQHYKELYDSIKLIRAKTIEKTNSLLAEIKNLKAQIKGKMTCVTMPAEKPKVLAPGMYVIDVEPIPPRNRNNREVHLDYLKHLKESVETLCEIVEEARVEKPLDRALASVCLYTKQSQKLLEYPRRNTKKDRTLPAKSDKQKVEDHPRINKSIMIRKNRVDSSISYKRTIINSNSNYVCKTCNKCLMSFNHDECVMQSLKFVRKPPVNKVWRVKQVKQVWQATGKLCANVDYQWKPTRRKFTLGERCLLTRITTSKVVPVRQPKTDSTSNIVITERLRNTSQKPLTRYQRKNKQEKATSTDIPTIAETQTTDSSVIYTVVHIVLWYLDSGYSKHMIWDRSWLKNFVKKFIRTVRFGNDHFGAIMGYGDYVIGDSVISRVYYVQGLGHNLFSVGQFCDSDLEVAFRKHLYMMKSSPICLLSKASKNKSWLWHRWLNHLNFGIINDLARKDLARGLPRLKFEKDHLCSACQLGKSQKYSHKPKLENTNLEVLNTLHMDLCGPMQVQTINGKKYILVIVDDYSRFTWVKFLRSKDETPEFVIKFLKQIQVGLNKTNGVVERRNRTLVEAAQTMLIFSKAPMFLWAEAVAIVTSGNFQNFK